MRICAAADIHYPRTDVARCAAIAERMCASGADVIVLAGDIATGTEKHFRKLLRRFDAFDGPKLFVPGNHDLWSVARNPDTHRRYRTALANIVANAGFHYLPGNPLIANGVGFAGTVGWYDYAFRQAESPSPGLRVTPLLATRSRDGVELLRVVGREGVPWEELTEEDYSRQALSWREDGHAKQIVWNDAVYVDWGAADREVCQALAQELACDVAKIEDEADRWIGICHFVPFEELAGEVTDHVEAAYCRAFIGSPVFGKVFGESPKCRLVLCGHRHRQQVLEVGDLVGANCSVGDGKSGPLLLTLPE